MNTIQGENVKPRSIEDEMRDSYLDYSMSVIVQRALPDVRDGLKPVHRRILFGMNELGLNAGKPYKKSARIVGDVMGKYHPHGDSAIYDALVRMVQPFSLRYPLVNGQGNFGSIDGDGAAAMRYTEARMQKISEELLTDIDKETVDYIPNYDDSLREPSVLPSRIPNLLVNGSSGIAVGMATNIPPHNLCEIVDALTAIIGNPEITIDELMHYIQGPDFPTGGIIYGISGVREGLKTGRGRVIVRARAVVETPKQGRDRIVVIELPYQVNKSRLIERIAELVNEKKIVGIADIRDESDRDGMRLVIELKREAVPEVVLNNLYAHTALQTTFGVNMLALVGGVPKLLNIKDALYHYLEHRHEVVTRRTNYDLARAKEREHIFEGLKIAVDNIDEVIAIIRSSEDTSHARDRLIERFGLSEIQAKEILDMRLARLTGLERQKIIDELKMLKELIFELNEILASKEKRMEIVKDELIQIKELYGDERRTELVADAGEFTIEDMIAEEDMVISVTRAGYIKRFPVSGYRRQKRGGTGMSGHIPKQEDIIKHLFVASTHDYLLFFSNRGQCYWLKVHEIPALGRAARGKPVINLLQIAEGEKIAAMVKVSEFDDDNYVFFATRKGIIKKTPLSAFSHPSKRGIIAINIGDDDELCSADLTDGTCDIVIGSSGGKAVRCNEKDIRPMGRNAAGVIGIKMEKNQKLVGMVVMRREGTLLVATENGYGKRSSINEYRLTRRGAQGVIAMRTSERTGAMVAIMEVVDSDDLLIMTSSGKVIRQQVSAIRTIGRVTQGVRLIRLHEADLISDIAKVVRDEDDDENDQITDEIDENQQEFFENNND
ncbi:DNA gyrase subunit A [bacterium]|nr:DNA gyrase subunit A [bacterium]